MERIAIIGTGLIGGSVGMALKAAKLPDLEVTGYDQSGSALHEARRRGAIDSGSRDLGEAVRDARLVIIATPPLAARVILEDAAPHLAEGAIVTDTLSTKAEIMAWAQDLLPASVSFVGGHPMAGKEGAGVEHADAALFREKAYCVVPSPRASEGAVKSILGLVSVLGAEPVFIDAGEHDQYVAAVSHLPMVASVALFTLARSSTAWQDLRNLAGSGFRDLTRLASGDAEMSHDICATNGEAVIHWIDRYIEEMRRFRDLIADDPGELFKAFAGAQLQRDAFMTGSDKPQREPLDMPSASEQLGSVLFGGFLTQRYKEYEKRMNEVEARQRREQR